RRALPHDLYSSFISHSYGDHRYLASFPTRRSSDLLAFPQDVQTEAYDYPEESLARRVWHIARPEPDSGRLAEAVALIRGAKRPLIVAGGGVIYSEATDALRTFVEQTGIPVGETQAGK